MVVADCPNEAAAATLAQSAVRDVGLLDAQVVTTVIDSPHEAERRGFLGSPTIMIEGRDPFGEPGQRPRLACRVYPHPDGPSGLPDVDLLWQALKHAADIAAPSPRTLYAGALDGQYAHTDRSTDNAHTWAPTA